MKDFIRTDLEFSLCGLNCGLCSMRLGGHCPGCGGGEGNQSCKIAKCSLQHGKPEYCSHCQEFPCEKYEEIDAVDSFITHQNQKKGFKETVGNRRQSIPGGAGRENTYFGMAAEKLQ